MKIVFLGLSLTSSWGNGHATTYRGLVRELCRRHHDVLFLERDAPWYAAHRDLANPPWGRTRLYAGLDDLRTRFFNEIESADFVVVGSYVPDGVAVSEWVLEHANGATAFYDIDTPVTVEKLERKDYEYIAPHLIPLFDLYLSFNGGPVLQWLKLKWGARRALPLYCSADPAEYFPEAGTASWDLGYMGTYSGDRQPALERLMLDAARRASGRFVVAGPQFPPDMRWPANVERIEHLAPGQHRGFYNSQRYTLNITRSQMVKAGYAPSVRLFEAAACGTPVITDWWKGIDAFFTPGKEIFVSQSAEQTLHYLYDIDEEERRGVGEAARSRMLAGHTAAHRAEELEKYALDVLQSVGTNSEWEQAGHRH